VLSILKGSERHLERREMECTRIYGSTRVCCLLSIEKIGGCMTRVRPPSYMWGSVRKSRKQVTVHHEDETIEIPWMRRPDLWRLTWAMGFVRRLEGAMHVSMR